MSFQVNETQLQPDKFFFLTEIFFFRVIFSALNIQTFINDRSKSQQNLKLSSGLQVSEHLDDVLGHGWGSGQVVTGGLESVLISHPGDGVGDGAFGVGEFTLGHGSGFFGLVSDLLLDSALADGDSVLGLVAERVLLLLGVVVLGLFDDEDDGFLVLGGGGGGGDGQEDGEQDHLHPFTSKSK